MDRETEILIENMNIKQVSKLLDEIENEFGLRSKMPFDIREKYDLLNLVFVGFVWERKQAKRKQTKI